MELREIIKIAGKYRYYLLAGTILGTIAGIGLYFLPVKYYTTGSLFVARKAQPPIKEYFTYEGYYSQQAAEAYAKTVAAILESYDFKKQTLESLGRDVSDKNLSEIKNNTKVKRASPQLITLTTSSYSQDEAKNMWNAMVGNLIKITERLNVDGDKMLSVNRVTPEPITKVGFRSAWADSLLGGMTFFTLILVFMFLKEYLSSPVPAKKVKKEEK